MPRHLSQVSQEIVDRVMNALDEAEEMGGPEGQEYLDLMETIKELVSERAQIYADSLNERY